MFEIVNEQAAGPVIRVIGVGGAGGNAVDHMIEQGVEGVEFFAVNTDAQVLSRSRARNQFQLGPRGLGAGAKPEEARSVALADRERLEEAIAGSHMVFITAGMGGGTGTGAGPVIAEVARSLGILTVAVVTKPFTWEGSKRMKIAEQGIEELAPHVDSLIVILNDKLEEVLGDDVTQEDAFEAAEDATIIYGGVYDDALGEELRVTVVATGLGQPLGVRQQKPQLVVTQKTGTDNQALVASGSMSGSPDYNAMSDTPAVFRKRDRAAQVEALANSGVEKYDIPAFLRKQAD